MTVVTTLPDGRIIAKVKDAYRVIPVGGGAAALAPPSGLSISELKRVEEVLQVNFPSAIPATTLTPLGLTISGNVVGLTIQGAAGTTIITEVVALGF